MPRKSKPTGWKNRIVGTGTEQPDQLLANPANFRIHSTEQGEALDGTLNTLGWIQNVIVNRRTGCIVDGHLRVQRALRRGEPVPVLYVDLTENEERIALATLDPIAAMAGTDEKQLAQLLDDITADDPELLAFLEGLHPQSGDEGGGGSSTPDEAITVWGEIINLGNHRILCGDIEDESHRLAVTSGMPGATVRDFSDLAILPLIAKSNPAQLFVIHGDAFAIDGLVMAWEAATGKAAERITPG